MFYSFIAILVADLEGICKLSNIYLWNMEIIAGKLLFVIFIGLFFCSFGKI